MIALFIFCKKEMMVINFKEYLQGKGKSNLTITTYINETNIFKEWFYDSFGNEAKKLHRVNFLEYLSYLRNVKNYKASTINKKIASLLQYNNYLIENKVQEKHVILSSDFIKIQKNVFSPVQLSLAEVETLRQKILDDENLRLYTAVTILAFAGLRINELVNLKVEDISFKEKSLYIIGKRNKFRKVIVNRRVEIALKEYIKKQSLKKSDYIFKSNRGGHISKNIINRKLKKYTENIHPHQFRHFYAYLLLAQGIHIHQIAFLMGHKSVQTTLRYLNSSIKDITDKIYNT